MSTIKMSEELNHNRRRFLRNATVAFAAAELATIGSADAQSSQTSPARAPQIRPGTNDLVKQCVLAENALSEHPGSKLSHHIDSGKPPIAIQTGAVASSAV